jgi:hypothetical protein
MTIANAAPVEMVSPEIHQANKYWTRKRNNWRERYEIVSKEIRFNKGRAETVLNEEELARYKQIRQQIRMMKFENNRAPSKELSSQIRQLKRLLRSYNVNAFKPQSRREYMVLNALKNSASEMMFRRGDITYFLQKTAHPWV